MKDGKWFEDKLSPAVPGLLPAGASEGLVTMGSCVHGSTPHFPALCCKQAHVCIFCLLQLSQLQCSFPDCQSNSPGQEMLWG